MRNSMKGMRVARGISQFLFVLLLLTCGVLSAQNQEHGIRNIVLVHGAWAMAPATSSYPSAAMALVERCGRSSDRSADSRRTEVATVKPGVFLAIFLVWILPTGRVESPRRVDIIAERSVCSSFKTSTWHGEVNRVPDAEAAQALTCVADFAAELPTEKYGTKMTPSGVVTNSNHIHSHISLDMKPNRTTRDECDDEFRLLERTGKGTSWRQRRNCP
jgi:hypothetical protein